jgi:hypothetical protein
MASRSCWGPMAGRIAPWGAIRYNGQTSRFPGSPGGRWPARRCLSRSCFRRALFDLPLMTPTAYGADHLGDDREIT